MTVTTDGAGVVSHVGSRLLAGLADRSGLTEAFSDARAGLRESRSGHDPGRVLTDLAVLLADGGRSISRPGCPRGSTRSTPPNEG